MQKLHNLSFPRNFYMDKMKRMLKSESNSPLKLKSFAGDLDFSQWLILILPLGTAGSGSIL